MIKSSYQVATVFGIPIRLDISLIILLGLLIMQYGDPIMGLLAAVALLLSITLHELGHSLVAMAFGCRVRDITLMMMGGCATLLSMPRKAWQEFLVAAAGPAVSLCLAVLGLTAGKWVPQGGYIVLRSNFESFLFYNIGVLNAVLFLFNLLPAFPMDGGRILRAILQQFFMSRLKATWVASRIGRFIAILMALSVGYSLISGEFHGFMFIRLVIAYFVYQAAGREYLAVLYESQQGGGGFGGGFGGGSKPPDDTVVVSPPPYGSGKEWHDVHRM